MTRQGRALLLSAILLLPAPLASAEPILKPRKYQGPIPQNAISLRAAGFGGASNEEMIEYLDGRLQPPFEAQTEDFGTGLTIEANYIHKPHPQFGVRVNGAVSFLESTGDGVFVPQIPNLPDSILLPELEYSREFKVELITLEVSGVYFFTDASANDLQPFLGGGFSFGFPHETITETRVNTETGEPYTDEIPGIPSEASEWDFSAGVHLVTGLIWYFTHRWGMNAEARVQMMEGRFDQLQAYAPDTDQFEDVSFVVDYSGFYMSLGVTYGF
jgi:hypothetical protein